MLGHIRHPFGVLELFVCVLNSVNINSCCSTTMLTIVVCVCVVLVSVNMPGTYRETPYVTFQSMHSVA